MKLVLFFPSLHIWIHKFIANRAHGRTHRCVSMHWSEFRSRHNSFSNKIISSFCLLIAENAMNMSKKKEKEKKNIFSFFCSFSLASSLRSTFHVSIVNSRRGDSKCADLLMQRIEVKQKKKRERHWQKKKKRFFYAAKMNCLQNFNIPFIDSMNINCANNAYSTLGTINNDRACVHFAGL